MKYLVIDIETGGLGKKCSILEVAAIAAVGTKPFPFLHCFVAPPEGGYIVEPYAARMHARNELWEDLVSNHKHTIEETVNQTLMEFIGKHFPKDRPIIAGKNAVTFDLPRLDAHHDKPGTWYKHRVLDIGNLALEPYDDGIPNTTIALGRYGITPNEQHRAIPDCEDVVKFMQAWSNR